MRKSKAGQFIFSPSDLTTFLESPFSSWMDRYEIEFPRQIARDPEDESNELVKTKGLDHEREVLELLKKEYGEVTVIAGEGEFSVRHAATLSAMKAGPPVIYQAALENSPFMGYADFLVKVPGKSDLGDFHYEPWDSKLARSTKPYFVIQLLAYSEMLQKIQGVLPREIVVVLGTKERKHLKLADFFAYYISIKERFLAFQGAFDPKNKPMPRKKEEIRNWSDHAAQVVLEADDLSQVAGIKAGQSKRLTKAGIKTLTALATTKLAKVPNLETSTLEKLKRQARLQLESKGLEVPKFEVLEHLPGQRRGLQMLPPPSRLDVYFDMEGYPLYEDEGLEYLFGAVYLDEASSKVEFIDFWAHDRPAEKVAFEAWIDWVFARFKADPAMHIFHYAAYEVTAMRKLSTQFATREFEVDELLKSEVFVDLFKVVTQGLAVGEDSYSIKSIEHLYDVKRSGAVTNAGDSIVEYARYLANPDGPDWKSSPILKTIRDYNEVDCISTLKLAEWLRGVQKERSLPYVAPAPRGEDSLVEDITPAARLAGILLGELEGKLTLTEPERIQKLLGELLEFHRREQKQYWWKYFDWLAGSHHDLIGDSECIGAISRTDTPLSPVKRSFLAEYTFDPSQDVKFRPGSDCTLMVDAEHMFSPEIVELDTKVGRLVLKIGPSITKAFKGGPSLASILPKAPPKAEVLSESILATVTAFSETKAMTSLPPALLNLLARAAPGLSNPSAPINVDAISLLDGGAICIQGPPGAGKTYTGARVILSLLKSGKKVGIASNSHHAVENLLIEVSKIAKQESFGVAGYKVGGNSEEFLAQSGFESVKSDAFLDFKRGDKGHLLVGGTAWFFSRPEVANGLDYLFVDEAGQVALANLVAMAPCAKNLVIMGDQRQLEQPTQGAHPGESGESCLTYLLQDHATIPAHLGIFLDNTFRMRPEVCDFVSRSFYESRLKSAPQTLKNELRPCPALTSRVQSSGISFLAVSHEDNSQSSIEEVEVVKGLVQDLLESSVLEDGVERRLAPRDILVVAPYNLQVGLLKDHLPPEISVGSVDKFQGKEAHVVILSMCSSSLEDSPRGVEFLLNPNRLNVALSRAKCLAIVVGNPNLRLTDATSIDRMKMVNLFCSIARMSGV